LSARAEMRMRGGRRCPEEGQEESRWRDRRKAGGMLKEEGGVRMRQEGMAVVEMGGEVGSRGRLCGKEEGGKKVRRRWRNRLVCAPLPFFFLLLRVLV